MTERFIHSTENPRTRALLEAALREEPPAHALESTARVLGLSSAPLAGATTGILFTKSAKASLFVSATKWLVVGALAGSAVAGGAQVLESTPRVLDTAPARRPSTAERPRGVARAPHAVASSKSAHSPRSSENTPDPESSPRSRPAPVERATPPASIRGSAARSVPEEHALARETALIDAARRALARDDLAEAEHGLNTYDTERTLGVLDREATLLRIEFLRRSGRLARARESAARFIAVYPEDPHVARLRAFLEAPGIDSRP